MATVLVVEDDDDVREAMVEVLEEHGYATLSAADGLQALRCMRSCADLGVVLLDLSMPIMDGWECREQMLADAQLAKLPVILLSGTSSLDAEREELRADAVLAKPFSPDALLTEVARYGKPGV